MTKVALATGYISQNVGNAFFQLGAAELLRRAVGPENLVFIGDTPAHWTSNRKSDGTPDQWFPWLERMQGVDVFIVQGPELTANVAKIWQPIVDRMTASGVQFKLMSVSYSKYDQAERTAVEEFIRRNNIEVLSTRDATTFAGLRPCNPRYDGICSAWFMPWAVEPVALSGRFIASTFEIFPEPANLDRIHLEGEDDLWRYSSRSRRRIARSLGRRPSIDYVAQFLPPFKMEDPGDGKGVEIVRPVHRTNPALPQRIFRDRNFVASDEPFTYLSVYSSAEATYTDRVHAAVGALAFGRPTKLVSKSGRAALLERVGLKIPMAGLQTIDGAYLEEERFKQLEFLRTALF